MESLDKALFDQFPFARILIRIGNEDDLVIVRANPAAGELYDFDVRQAENKKLHYVLGGETVDILDEACRRCQKEKKTLITAAAAHRLTEVRQSLTLVPIVDTKGWVTHIDVIALPAEADKLSLQKERDYALMLMSSAFDMSNLGILVTDRHRRVLRVNDAFLHEFGFRRRDLIGLDFTQIFVPADRRLAGKAYKNFLGGQTSSARQEWRLRAPGGKESDVLVTTAPLHFNPDRPLVVHNFVDISDHKHLEESLRWARDQADSANRAKSAFLASMSHELRTPLNAILGFTELIRNETFGAVGHTKYQEYLSDIHFAASHLLEIINDVLDMSKIEAGKFELTETEVDVAGLFQSVARLMADRAAAAKIVLHHDIQDGLTQIMGDKRVLRQMLFNLVSNALKFSYPNSSISMIARQDPQTKEALLIVKDQGRGMDPKDIERMLEPFNQGQASISDGTGTGLGLPLTRAMAEMHGGKLHIESQIGKGTSVTVCLPAMRILSVPKSKMIHANTN